MKLGLTTRDLSRSHILKNEFIFLQDVSNFDILFIHYMLKFAFFW